MIYKENEFISYSYRGWEVQGQGAPSGEDLLAGGDSSEESQAVVGHHMVMGIRGDGHTAFYNSDNSCDN